MAFSVSPGESVSLVAGGSSGCPGVQVTNVGEGAVPPQTVSVALPPGNVLQFKPEAGAYLLIICDAQANIASYPGSLSGNSLVFQSVDLCLPGAGSTSVAWVTVAATSDSPAGFVNVSFVIGGLAANSSLIEVVRP
ncbi:MULTISPECIES: hypothetical protein [Streptomyces]|uniref:hypothetical protein n=1 Tax=Streptomyces TaxID=1883 RepID=UPI000765B7CB|nr:MULTISPECIES: hypothetical protein [Streptomyces]